MTHEQIVAALHGSPVPHDVYPIVRKPLTVTDPRIVSRPVDWPRV